MNFFNILLPLISIDDQVWSSKRHPKKGDHIRVNRGLYYHHGIYISDDCVIHFTGKEQDSILEWDKCQIICTSLDTFLMRGNVEIKLTPRKNKKNIDDIIKKAESLIGNKGYNLFTNNCEHFANYCTTGRKTSKQIENILPSIIFPQKIFVSSIILLAMNILSSQISQKSISKKVKTKITSAKSYHENKPINNANKDILYNYNYIPDSDFC